MRILQVTNIISPNQLPLARCLAAKLGVENFRFVATESPLAERVEFGWNGQEVEPWILKAGESRTDRLEFERWWDEADVVICDARRVSRMQDRLDQKKLTFYMSERWWKPPIGIARLLHPRFAWMAYRFCCLAQSPEFHYLPMGVYAASDMRRIVLFRGRMWDWGYYTAVPDPLPLCCKRDGSLRILWAGRMLAWKRVDTLIRAFALLLQRNVKAQLTLIGDGVCREELKQLAKKLNVADNVEFHSSMLTSQVRDQMRNAHIYVLPSSAYEGWGAVLNEAMSEGCAVVASEGSGAAKTMICHGENGLLFSVGNHQQLDRLLFQLSLDEPFRLRLAEAGQKTVSECWAPYVAAERFLAVSDALLSGRSVPSYGSGPMALFND